MEIREVCEKTGLTEKTIAYYVENILVLTETNNIKNSDDFDYTEKQVQELIEIADLRRAFFSIEDIISIKKYPWNINGILDKWYKNLQNERATKKKSLIECMTSIDFKSIENVSQLVKILSITANSFPLPRLDLDPYFIDSTPKSEKEIAIEQYESKQERLYFVGKRIVKVITILYILTTILNFFTSLIDGENVMITIISLGIRIGIAFALFYGVTWVRYLYCGFSIIAIMMESYILTIGIHQISEVTSTVISQETIKWFTALIMFDILFLSISTGLIMFHKGVKEFLYVQRNG